MSEQAVRRRRWPGILFALFVLAALGVLVGLGTWQLERLSWKEALIAELDAKLSRPPTDLPARERWASLPVSGARDTAREHVDLRLARSTHW